ncbi:MAG: hypothetical protein U0163_16860 [Gemmatimonadaceae bacterium]
MPWKRLVALAVLCCTAFGCSTSPEGIAQLKVSLTSGNASISLGDTLAVVASANGTNLVGMVIDYGDTVIDSYNTAGANSARVTFRHAYATRGTYTARVVVTDAQASQAEATLEVRVN